MWEFTGRGDNKAEIHFLAIRVNGQALNFGISRETHHNICEREAGKFACPKR
jgi:hypothetical protein